MSGSDIRDILEIGKPAEQVPKRLKQPVEKRPEGVSRELFSLIGSAAPAAFVQPTYKAKFNIKKKASPWTFSSFQNSAREDDLTLYHWVKAGPTQHEEYPFAKFSKKASITEYTPEEYEKYLTDKDWEKKETDYLFQLCREYELRFPVIADRYHFGSRPRTMEDIKDRYYTVVRLLAKARSSSDDDNDIQTTIQLNTYDKQREQERKDALKMLFNRTKEHVEEEEALLVEAKRIEQSAERLARDCEHALENVHTAVVSSSEPSSPSKKRKWSDAASKKSPSKVSVVVQEPVTDKKKKMLPGVSVRSQGLRTVKQHAMQYKVTKVMEELGIPAKPIMPTNDVCERYEQLQQAILGMFELKRVSDRMALEEEIRTAVEGSLGRPRREKRRK